ncbi:hypothetical protein [Psychroflexus planctonicus]|uniref:IPT/TIG domain-containing protein n=1 Tax=Psychroflexus planctonicus TaxID=1526575 RepID=A0ABQ1SMH5_9FLAO|nr:hypothetical protein [Psychroflexus planctonicus]GGE43960.1 hypothetical protein GCM10010832_24960 [Psychroflexus planctonicus]
MKIFRFCSKLLILFFIFGCSDDDQPTLTVNSLSSTQTFIGDTLFLTGKNLNRIGTIVFRNQESDRNTSNTAEIISKTETEIRFIVPELPHEKATIYFSSLTDPIDVELYGYIPYSSFYNGTIYRSAEVKQILNDDIAFCYDNPSNKRFKLTDNFSNYRSLPMYNFDEYSYYGDYSNYYYVNEYSGYIINRWHNDIHIHSFNDDTNSTNFEYAINRTDLNLGTGDYIKDFKFVSDSLAYFMNVEDEMFQILNGTATAFLDLYPELNNTPYLSEEYWTNGFQLLNDGSILILQTNGIYKIKNGEVVFNAFNGNLNHTAGYHLNTTRAKPAFINNNAGFYLESEQKIYKSNDYGETWTTYDVNFPFDGDGRIAIEYLGEDQFILHRYRFKSSIDWKSKYISTDNGNSWEIIFYSNKQGYGNTINMFDEYGFTGASHYGLVKFRRFPKDF